MPEFRPARPSRGDAEVPEADALEQAEEVTPDAPPPAPTLGVEVPEADAFEQAQEVPLDDAEEDGR